jgi:imidazolonepropionase-like amidohydrolase
MSGKNVLAIKGATLIDGTGAKPVKDAVVVVEDSKIVAVGKDVAIPRGARVVDAAGKTVMPGLIDSHMHFMGRKTDKFVEEEFVTPWGVSLIRTTKDAEALLDAGFTMVKDCGGEQALHLRRAIAEGTIHGPRILASGFALSQTFGHGDTHFLPVEWVDARVSKRGHGLLCDGVEECMKAARYALREGADFIKVCTTGGVMSERDRPEHTQFTIDEIKAIVQVARYAGTFVTAHCQGTEGMHNSIIGGIKTIDHAFYPDDEAIKMAKEKDVIFVPTLSIMHQINTKGKEGGMPEWGVRKCLEAWDVTIKNIRKIHDSKAKVALGTDYIGSPMLKHGTNALELQLLMEYCGFSAMDTIVSATKIGAEACGLGDKLGTIEKGKFADVIVVDGDPLKDVKILQNKENVKLVVKNGTVEVNRGLKVS